MIGERDVASYRAQGYLVVPRVLDPETVAEARRELSRLLDGAREVTGHTAVYDQNVSSLPRALLLYEYAAADAWPLLGVSDLADFDARLVTGAPTIEPRVSPAPVRLPLPPARNQGSIYENQTGAHRRFFPITDEPAAAPRT